MNFSMRQVLGFSALVWAIFGYISFVIPNAIVFHILNPASIALGVLLILVYGRGVIDALRNFEKVTIPHLLTFGVTLNWIGLIFRMSRWYLTGQHPSVTSDIDYWFYNLGLFISIWAGLFLLGAANLAVKTFKSGTMITIFLFVFGFLMYLGHKGVWYYHGVHLF